VCTVQYYVHCVLHTEGLVQPTTVGFYVLVFMIFPACVDILLCFILTTDVWKHTFIYIYIYMIYYTYIPLYIYTFVYTNIYVCDKLVEIPCISLKGPRNIFNSCFLSLYLFCFPICTIWSLRRNIYISCILYVYILYIYKYIQLCVICICISNTHIIRTFQAVMITDGPSYDPTTIFFPHKQL